MNFKCRTIAADGDDSQTDGSGALENGSRSAFIRHGRSSARKLFAGSPDSRVEIGFKALSSQELLSLRLELKVFERAMIEAIFKIGTFQSRTGTGPLNEPLDEVPAWLRSAAEKLENAKSEKMPR